MRATVGRPPDADEHGVLLPHLDPSLWYWCAAVAHALLLGYVLIAGGRGLARGQLLILASAGLVWSAFHAEPGRAGTGFPLDPIGFAAEMTYLAAWFLLLHRLLRGPYDQSMPDIVRRSLATLWFLLAVLGSLGAWLWYSQATDGAASGVLTALTLTTALACLALAAQLSRDAPVEGRQALKRLVAAASLAAGAQVLVSGVALLGGYAPSLVLMVRAILVILAVVLLGSAVHLKPQWSLAIFVSPQARTYMPRFMAMMGILGRVAGGDALLALAAPGNRTAAGDPADRRRGLPVMALLFSQTPERAAAGASQQAFPAISLRLPRRVAAAHRHAGARRTSACPCRSGPSRRWRRSSAVRPGCSGCAASLTGPVHCMAGWNTKMWSDARVRLDDPVVVFMIERQWILDTAELARRPGHVRRTAGVPGGSSSFRMALLLVPLISNEVLIGFMMLLQSSSAFRLTFEEIDLLRTSGRQVAAHLAQYEADQRLAEAKQFEAFNRLTAFLMHDLKNLIAQQSLVVKNAARHKGNPAFFEDTIATIDNSVARMSKLLQQLQSGEASGRRSAGPTRDPRCRRPSTGARAGFPSRSWPMPTSVCSRQSTVTASPWWRPTSSAMPRRPPRQEG